MTLRQFFSVVEIRTKLISVSTLSLAILYALWRFKSIHIIPSALCFAAAVLIDMGTTAFNSFFDYQRGVDSAQSNKEIDKVLVHEHVPAQEALHAALGCYACACILGIILACISGWWIIIAGAVGLLIGFLYSGGPAPISRSPLGELFAGGFLGIMLFLVAFRTASNMLDWIAVAASLPSFVLIASILAANNLCDMEGDRAAGRHTLPLALGEKWAECVFYCCGGAAFLLPIIFVILGIYPPWSALATIIAGLYAVPRYKSIAHRGYRHETKSPTMNSILRIFLMWTVGMTVGFAMGLLIT